MSYIRYRGVKNANGKRQYGPWHSSYFWQDGYKGAYRELKNKEYGWDFVIMEHYHDTARPYTEHLIWFIDKNGSFGKKNGVIAVSSMYSKGSLSRTSILKHGSYILSDGSRLYFDTIKKKKNTNEYGIPDNWHPFGL